jgi:HSP20 family protein
MSQPNPFEEIEKFFERMSRQFDEGGVSRLRDVSIDLRDTEDELVVTADLPGYEKDDIDLSIAGRKLTIEADRSEEMEEEEDARYIRRERSRRHVSRTIRLPVEVVDEEAMAAYNNGVLTVTLPKRTADEDESHDIDVE